MIDGLVSVIIPAYNGERFIEQAIDSVRAQTYPHWELNVVDDGSTDGTAVKVARYTDPRIIYIRQENQGLAAARNTGVCAAHGEYMAFLDADDEWLPGFFERCLSVLRAGPHLAGVYALNSWIDPRGIELPRTGGQVVVPDQFYERLLEGGFFAVHAALVRTALVREVGAFDSDLRSTEDWDLWLRIARRYPMVGIAEPLARYRVYPGTMATHAARMHTNRVAVLSKHLGAPQGEPATWPAEKRRAYAFAYRTTAVGYLQQHEPDTGWYWLTEAVKAWPPILARVDTFYELALGDQPRGYRGEATGVDLTANSVEMLSRLDALFASMEPPVNALRGRAYGNAYLALAMLADQSGDWPAARAYLLNALRSHPRLLSDRSVLRRLLKVSMGRQTAARIKSALHQG